MHPALQCTGMFIGALKIPCNKSLLEIMLPVEQLLSRTDVGLICLLRGAFVRTSIEVKM